MQLGSLAFVLTVAFLSTQASADPLQKSEDIVEFFEGASEFGPSRGICVGTEDECNGKKNEAPAEKLSLDMLVNFDLDSAELDATARAELDEFAKALKDSRLSALDFVVEGHTDASGPAHYNDGLSERRARSVTTFLTSNGIDPARIKATGMGETNPRNPDPYDPVNRRVEMRIRTE